MTGRGSGSVLPAWMTEAKSTEGKSDAVTRGSGVADSSQFRDSHDEESPNKGRGMNGIPLLPAGVWEALVRVKEDDASNNSGDVENKSNISTESNSNKFGNENKMTKNTKGPDWNCPSCGNVNWCWRANCNKCQAGKPKTSLSNEKRGGIGGGFSERQERASGTVVEVGEDGFDDFGRRIKSTSSEDAATKRKNKEAAALARLQSAYGMTGIIEDSGTDFDGTGKDGDRDSCLKDHGGRDKDRAKDRDSIRDSDKASSDYNRDQDRGRSSRNYDRDQDRGRSSRDYDRDQGRGRSSRDYDRDKDRGRSSRDYDRDRGSRDYDRDRGSRDYDRDKDRGRSSRNYDRDQDRGRSSRDYDGGHY